MEKDFFIITNDSSIGKSLAGQLPEALYRAHTLTSLTALTDGLPATSTCIAAIDIDTIEPDIQRIRALKKKIRIWFYLLFRAANFIRNTKRCSAPIFLPVWPNPLMWMKCYT